jgi:hypothetical protein
MAYSAVPLRSIGSVSDVLNWGAAAPGAAWDAVTNAPSQISSTVTSAASNAVDQIFFNQNAAQTPATIAELPTTSDAGSQKLDTSTIDSWFNVTPAQTPAATPTTTAPSPKSTAPAPKPVVYSQVKASPAAVAAQTQALPAPAPASSSFLSGINSTYLIYGLGAVALYMIWRKTR